MDMNIQTSVVTSPLNWAVSVCVHRLAQSGFLHAAAHCSHNNRACSHRQFIVAPTTVSRRNRTPRRWMKNPPPWGMPWRNWITMDTISCKQRGLQVYATCTRTIKALIHDMCVEISRCSCTLNSVWMEKVVKEGQLAKIQYSALQRDW